MRDDKKEILQLVLQDFFRRFKMGLNQRPPD